MTSVEMPVKDNLACSLAVFSSKFLDNWFFKNIKFFVFISLEWPCECSKRCISSDSDSKFLLEVNVFFLNKIWMQFDLISDWFDLAV